MCTVQGKGGKGHSKRKAPDELWTDGTIPERQNPLINFLADKLPKEFIQVPAVSPSCDYAFHGKKGRGNRVIVSCLCTVFSPPRFRIQQIEIYQLFQNRNSLQINFKNPIRRWHFVMYRYRSVQKINREFKY
jgi:hypothetical protein